jgi:hypothetical protein
MSIGGLATIRISFSAIIIKVRTMYIQGSVSGALSVLGICIPAPQRIIELNILLLFFNLSISICNKVVLCLGKKLSASFFNTSLMFLVEFTYFEPFISSEF